jgi:hypothetical protein
MAPFCEAEWCNTWAGHRVRHFTFKTGECIFSTWHHSAKQNGATLGPDIVSGILLLKPGNVFLIHGAILHTIDGRCPFSYGNPVSAYCIFFSHLFLFSPL